MGARFRTWQRPECKLRLRLRVVVLCVRACRDLGQAGGECGVVMEKERVANFIAGLLKKLTECLGKRGGILSAEKQHAIVDVDQASSIVAALGILGAGDNDVDTVSSVGEERASIAFRTGLMLVSGLMIDAGQDLTKDLVAQTINLG